MTRRGYTLMELMITVVVIGIIAGMAIPNYQKTVRRGRLRAATDVLRTIAAGEKVFFAFNDAQYKPITIASPTTDWSDIFMDNPNIITAGSVPTATQYVFVVQTPTPQTFRAFALVQSTLQSVMSIDQDGIWQCTPTPPYLAADFPLPTRCPP